MPLTALRMTSSGRRSSISSSVRVRRPPGIAGVAVVELLLELLAGHRDLLGVHDDHEVAHVAVRRVLGLALAPQRVRDLGGQPAERLAARVDHEPVALAVCGVATKVFIAGEAGRGTAARAGKADPRGSRGFAPPNPVLYCRASPKACRIPGGAKRRGTGEPSGP